MFEEIWNNLIGDIDTYQGIIAIVLALSGSIAALLNGVISIVATASSSPVEVTLMNKKEQYKYKNSNYLMLWIVFSALLLYLGAFSLMLNMKHDEIAKNNVTVAIENERVSEKESMIKKMEDTQEKIELDDEELTSDSNAVENEAQPDNMNAMIYIIGFLGILGVGSILVVLSVSKSLILFVKCIKKYIDKKNCFWVVGGLVTIISCVVFFLSGNLLYFLMGSIVWLGIIGYMLMRRRLCIERIMEVLRLIFFVFVFVIVVAINNIYIWAVNNYYTLISVFKMALVSIALSAVLCVLTSLIVRLNIYPGKAKVKYYDRRLDKNVYLYFRFNDEFFVAGEEEKIDACESYYFVRVDEVIGERLDKVSYQKMTYSKVYNDNITLQIENKPDISLNDIINKFITFLQDNKVDEEEYKGTKIYIKPKDGMIYFDLPGEKISKDKQKVGIYD